MQTGTVQQQMQMQHSKRLRGTVFGRWLKKPDIAALALLLVLSSCCVPAQGAFSDASLPDDKDATDIVSRSALFDLSQLSQNVSNVEANLEANFSIPAKLELEDEEDNMLFIDLNRMVVATYAGSILKRTSLETQFYVTQLPHTGQLFQAYRATSCSSTYPLSCDICCTSPLLLSKPASLAPEARLPSCATTHSAHDSSTLFTGVLRSSETTPP